MVCCIVAMDCYAQSYRLLVTFMPTGMYSRRVSSWVGTVLSYNSDSFSEATYNIAGSVLSVQTFSEFVLWWN